MAAPTLFGIMLTGWINLALASLCFVLAYRIKAVLSGPIALIGAGALVSAMGCIFGMYACCMPGNIWMGTAVSAITVGIAIVWITKIFT